MLRRGILIFSLTLCLTAPVLSDEQTEPRPEVLTDPKAVAVRAGKFSPLDAIPSPKAILENILGAKKEEIPSILLANHDCQPELVPISDSSIPKPDYLKEGLSSETLLRLLGSPSQKTFCLACPLWMYPEGFVVFAADRSVAFWVGKGFEKYRPPVEKKPGPVKVSMTKDEVCGILGSPDGGIYGHNDWRYGKSHVIFSKNSGLVTHLLRFDSSIP